MDLAFNPGTCGETLTSAWAVVDENDTPLGPPLLLEVMRLVQQEHAKRA